MTRLAASGAVTRVLSQTPAVSLRLLTGGQQLLFLAKVADDQELRRLDLSKSPSTEQRLLRLPTQIPYGSFFQKGAPAHPELVALSLQSEDGFSASGNKVCIALLDRNVNMMSFAHHYEYDLATGKHKLTVLCQEGGADSTCLKSAEPTSYECGVAPPPRKELPLPSPQYPFFVADGELKRLNEKGAIVRVANLAAGQTDPSPSGRWVLLLTGSAEGDYIANYFLLMDRKFGTIYDLKDDRLRRTISPSRVTQYIGLEVTAEASQYARWYADPERLVFDGKLIVPTRGITRVGAVAF